jgi:hypothetical protein
VSAFLIALAIAAPAGSSYCSPSGDVCYGIVRRRDGVVLRIDTIERYFARYTLCVTSPRRRRVCGSFPIFRNGPVWTSTVRWQRQFPNHGRGRYEVSWRLGSPPLGPVLSFRR